MPSKRPALMIFFGGALPGASELEQIVADAQAAATLDLLDRAARSAAFSQVILVTEHIALAAQASQTWDWTHGVPLKVVSVGMEGDKPFHFGETLRAVCDDLEVERVVYVGGAGMPLGTERDLADLALAVSGAGECVVANNLFSADIVAFQPASALSRITLPTSDNDLAWLLHFRAGLPFAPLPRTLATQLDIDTPTDLATLWWACAHGLQGSGRNLGEVLEGVPGRLPALADTIERAYGVMATRRAEIMVAGRVSSWVWRRLETNLPCQTRIISEERGMKASGREAQGEVRSLLGMYSDRAGISGLIGAIEQLCDAAFLDTRVLFAHNNLKPSAQDRFASDANLPDLIMDGWVREFTEAAMASRVPIVLGGHSLVSGGVWALSEHVRAVGSAG